MQSAIANAIHTLKPSFLQPSDMHFSESCLSIHHKLPHKQHSLQHHSAREPLPPPCAHSMLICTKKSLHSEELDIFSKCKHTKEDDHQTNVGPYTFIALLFHIQENANTALIASKHNASTVFLQETCSFHWHEN